LNIARAVDNGSPCTLADQIYVHNQSSATRSRSALKDGRARVCRLDTLSTAGVGT
jgi:hypothetical protein